MDYSYTDFVEQPQRGSADRITQILQSKAPAPQPDPQLEFQNAIAAFQAQNGVSQGQNQSYAQLGVQPQQSTPLDQFKQQVTAGNTKAVVLDKRLKSQAGNDPVAYDTLAQAVIDHPDEVDPSNSYQFYRAIAPSLQRLAMQGRAQIIGAPDTLTLQQKSEKHMADMAASEALAGKYAATAAGGGGSGGVTQFVYNKTKAALEAAGVQITPQMEMEIISASRNGLQKGSTITVNGKQIAIENIMGAEDSAAAMEYAKDYAGASGTNAADLTGKPAIESAVVSARNIADLLSKQGISDDQAMPLLDGLDSLNEKTFDTPYANIAQVPAQFFDKYQDQTVAFDLMAQSRTNLAIPLAKALGVNPTDKDFNATLDSIFNSKSSKASRRAQIASLRQRIAVRRKNNPVQSGVGNSANPAADSDPLGIR